MKFCIDCKHYVLEDGINNPELGHCTHNRPISPVTGLPTPVKSLPWCNIERMPHKSCGEDAKLFEEKEASNV